MEPSKIQKGFRAVALVALIVCGTVLVFVVRLDVHVLGGTLAEVEVDGRTHPVFSVPGWPPPEGSYFVGRPGRDPGEPGPEILAAIPGTDRRLPILARLSHVEFDVEVLGRVLFVMPVGGEFDPGPDRLLHPSGIPASRTVWRIVRMPNGPAYLAAWFRAGFERHGILSPILYVLVYVVGTVILFPATILTIVGAFAFGRLWGSVWVMVGMNLGGAAAFLVGRWIGRDAVEKLLPPKVADLSKRLEKRGFLAILLLRLIPVCPYNLLNYAAGITRMRFVDYFIGGMIGMAPVMILWVQATLSITDMRLAEPLSWLPVAALAILVMAPLLLLRVRWSGLAGGEKETPGTG